MPPINGLRCRVGSWGESGEKGQEVGGPLLLKQHFAIGWAQSVAESLLTAFLLTVIVSMIAARQLMTKKGAGVFLCHWCNEASKGVLGL